MSRTLPAWWKVDHRSGTTEGLVPGTTDCASFPYYIYLDMWHDKGCHDFECLPFTSLVLSLYQLQKQSSTERTHTLPTIDPVFLEHKWGFSEIWVFIHGGTPKSSIFIGYSLINHPAIEVPQCARLPSVAPATGMLAASWSPRTSLSAWSDRW